MKNKYHKKKNQKRTNKVLTVLLATIKNQFKQKIQNGSL